MNDKYNTIDLINVIGFLSTMVVSEENNKSTNFKEFGIDTLAWFVFDLMKCQGAIMAIFPAEFETTVNKWKFEIGEKVCDTELAFELLYIVDLLPELVPLINETLNEDDIKDINDLN